MHPELCARPWLLERGKREKQAAPLPEGGLDVRDPTHATLLIRLAPFGCGVPPQPESRTWGLGNHQLTGQ